MSFKDTISKTKTKINLNNEESSELKSFTNLVSEVTEGSVQINIPLPVDLDKEKTESGFEDININLKDLEVIYYDRHDKLQNLDYEHAGHIGFESEEHAKESFAATLNISQVAETGVVTIQLVNKKGEVIDTKTLDLPTEKIIRSIALDYPNKRLVFTLGDGSVLYCDISILINTLTNLINTETERATQAEATLTAGLAAEVTRATEAEEDLSDSISAEESARLSGDASLQSSINAEALARQGADTQLADDIEDETEAREAADTTLQGNITAETNRATAAEGDLDDKIDEHIADTSNPHSVTKAQVGLSNVVNKPLDTDATSLTDGNYVSSGAMKNYVSTNGGKIDHIFIEDVEQTITNKTVTLPGITTQTQTALDAKQNNLTAGTDIEIVNDTISFVNADNFQTDSQVSASITLHNSSNQAHSDIRNSISGVSDRVTTIEGKIPQAAGSSNQLADKEWVNSSIENMAAFYVTKRIGSGTTEDPYQYVAFSTKNELNTIQTVYIDGTAKRPGKNDYAIVLADESKQGELANPPTTRYLYPKKNTQPYDPTAWEFQYIVNNTGLTQTQINALNSGITSTKVGNYDAHLANTSNPHSVTKAQVGLGNCDNTSDLDKPISTLTQTALDGKQATLTEGAGIDITNNTISVVQGVYFIDILIHNISTTLNNAIASPSNPTSMDTLDTAVLSFSNAEGFKLPDTVTVTGCNYVWSKIADYSATLTLTNPVSAISITITGEPINIPLCFTAETAGATVGIIESSNIFSCSTNYAYSRDLSTWTSFSPTSSTGTTPKFTLTNIGDKIYFRADASSGRQSQHFNTFVMTGLISASGNVMSMYDATNWESITTIRKNYALQGLFSGCSSLTTPPILPATTLATNCYQSMFVNCTNLRYCPELPATTLATNCYNSMFYKCTTITTPPELKSTSAPANCYANMFYGCTSLTSVPKLRANYPTTYDSYRYMFYGCTSLYISKNSTAEANKAWRIPESGYITNSYGVNQDYMFYGCLGTRQSNSLVISANSYVTFYTQNEPV